MTASEVARELEALAGIALSPDELARLAQQAEGLRASVAKLAQLDLQSYEPAVTFALDEGDDG